jgi:hypothetical protein
LLAWLVGKVPSLASAFGVVSVKAFDAVLRGIEKAKDQNAKQAFIPCFTGRADCPRREHIVNASGDSRRGQTGELDRPTPQPPLARNGRGAQSAGPRAQNSTRLNRRTYEYRPAQLRSEIKTRVLQLSLRGFE